MVRDGQVMLVDETTGRAAPGRAWSSGLHQLVEWKEGVAASLRKPPSRRSRSSASSRATCAWPASAARCPRRAPNCAGSTACEVVVIPRRVASRVQVRALAAVADSAALWQAVAARRAALAARAGRCWSAPRRVAAVAATVAGAAGRRHRPPGAATRCQDADEAALIARAGQRRPGHGATSMAGRGTDIQLDQDGSRAPGGLHVIAVPGEPSRAHRPPADRPLCAPRRPGSAERLLSLEDELFDSPACRVGCASSPPPVHAVESCIRSSLARCSPSRNAPPSAPTVVIATRCGCPIASPPSCMRSPAGPSSHWRVEMK